MGNERITQRYKKLTLADGREYKVYPLTLKQAKQAAPVIDRMSNIDEKTAITDPKVFDNVIEICTLILKKGNDDITKERIEEIIDVKNVTEVINAGLGK